MRLFVAIPIPEKIRRRASELMTGLPDECITKVRPENMHLTLKFIGEVQPSKLNEITEALGDIAFVGFDCALHGIGAFPDELRPKVIWVGAESNRRLEMLASLVMNALHGFGKEEERGFSGHFTIARIKSAVPLEDFFGKNRLVEFGEFFVDKFELIESRLGPGGPEYRILSVFEAKK